MANPCTEGCCSIILSMFVILFLGCGWTSCIIISRQCNQNNYTEGTEVAKNIKTVLDNLVKASKQPAAFNISVVGQGSNTTVYGLLQCRGDHTANMCFNCSQNAKQVIQTNCSRSLGVTIWYPYCFIRYEIYNFTGKLQPGSNFGSYYNIANASDPESFDNTKEKLLKNLVAKASSDLRTRYATDSAVDGFVTIYGLVQCWRDISTDDCHLCLDSNVESLFGFTEAKIGGVSIDKNCIVEYEINSFFGAPAIDDAARPAAAPVPTFPPLSPLPFGRSNKTSNNVTAIVGGSAGGFVVLLLFLGGFFFLLKHRKTAISRGPHHQTRTSNPRQKEQKDLVNENSNILILFTAEELRIATKNFDDELKLGEGGFGSVYKGTLLNGQSVAVKKLFLNASQAKDEFMNEMKVMINVQHRNLLNLVGCCIEDSENIIVYEYLCNGSLDKFIFDPEKKNQLNWRRRFNIILGVAKGLLYLHEDSNIRIIHRDIKASNILLDQIFEPKIADFGLAKLFSDEKSRILTRVAGTRGYLAPEYAMQGQLSIKVDVYSFGILLIEIICGRRNNDIHSFNQQSILAETWRLFREGNVFDIVDASIKLNCVQEQVIRFMHVGLLCTQAKAALRPPMSRILCMLSDASVTLPYPTMPAFVNFTGDSDSNSANGGHTPTAPRIYDSELSLTLPR